MVLRKNDERAFWDFYRGAHQEGELDAKTVQLVSLAAALVGGCEP